MSFLKTTKQTYQHRSSGTVLRGVCKAAIADSDFILCFLCPEPGVHPHSRETQWLKHIPFPLFPLETPSEWQSRCIRWPWGGECAGWIQLRVTWEESFDGELFRSGWPAGMSLCVGARQSWLPSDIGRLGQGATPFPAQGAEQRAQAESKERHICSLSLLACGCDMTNFSSSCLDFTKTMDYNLEL